ncbi:hypothetical protein [Hymenobacter persicinus]|uniref:Uncharacterized protein n=1 Tax=Hymenobacter persicinus TaxID=2025506 RepID=A0A4V1ZB20_9BACT|nr:hypothetical protein [Hymenobacter persicinus]RYU82118.1 hypothetical protein EWM57_04875 [Hymenobacter persicinus]
MLQPYCSYASSAAAQPLLAVLDQHGIAYQTHIDSSQPGFDPTFAYNAPQAQLVLLVDPADRARVARLEQELNQALLAQVSPDHYLFTFSPDELLELVLHAGEWTSFDVLLAHQLLQQQGYDTSPAALSARVPHSPPPPARSHMQVWGVVGRILVALIGLAALYRLLAGR